MYEYKAKVLDIHDGDTITALIDLGFHVQIEVKVRFYGINAPEITGPTKANGLKSKQRVIELISGKDVILKTYKDKQEKYGRWLADVYPPNSPDSVNSILLKEGLAVSFMVD
jgi:micrococcal nuclease